MQDLESRIRQALLSLCPEAIQVPTRDACLGKRPASAEGVRIKSFFYGVSSLHFFLKRMSSFLTTELNLTRPGLVEQLGDGIDSLSLGLPEEVGGCFLQRSREDHFLDVFWHTHHFSFPIIHEAEFRKHYRNSWIDSASGTFRTASPLVDIVLALCVQFGTSCIPHSGATGSPTSDEPCYLNLAGYQY